MMRLSSNRHKDYGCKYLELALVFAFLLQMCSQLATCRSIIEFLPGFEGPLPFELEIGYVGVGESEEVQAFYYFFKSEGNPPQDPLLLWLSGGPGCSSLSGLVYEIGPLAFKNEEYNGSLPNLVLRRESWTKVSSIIFVDLPAGTGFSYAKTERAVPQGDWKLIHHTHQFLRKWLKDHPEFLSNQLYIGGDSYSGIPVPGIVQEISNGNENGIQPWINIQGYLLGNALTTRTEKNYQIPYAHGMGLISDELYESLQRHCKGEYINVDSQNAFCLRELQSFDEATSRINLGHILEANCGYDLPKPPGISLRRSLTEIPLTYLKSHHDRRCARRYGYFLSAYWANDGRVREALHIPKGSVGEWQRCNRSIPYSEEISSSFPFHVNLSAKGYRSLIYSGDHDFLVTFLATQAWVRALNHSIIDDWRPWNVDGQIAGYTRTYSNGVTFATVKGAGHTAPEYAPEECIAMFSRWISNTPL